MAGEVLPESHTSLTWAPWAGPQHALVKCPVDEIFFGGARGGGKTDGMLGKFAVKAQRYGKDCIGIFFRRTREDLKEAIARSQAIYGPIGATWLEQKNEWRFSNGARLKFEYLARDKDAQNYQGHNYTDVFFEELTNWPDPAPINKLRATLRSGAGVPCQFHATGNPGGPGHQWVKARYIDPAPQGWKVLYEEFKNPFTGDVLTQSRIFIPSKLSDNPALMADPTYVAKLQQSGSEELVKAWLHGDWSVIEGAYFDCWDNQRHVIRPFEVPKDWTRFRSFDWGSARPFSCGWWAIVGDAFEHPDGFLIPRGALVRYREWYGAQKDRDGKTVPNTGLKLTAESIGAGVVERDGGEMFAYSVADPAAFARDGGPSHIERMHNVGAKGWRRADNKRTPTKGHLGGWDQMRARLEGEDDRPMAYCFSTCVDSIRTIPALQHDENKPEDIDTESEDHAADEWRYACMSRPYLRPEKPAEAAIYTLQQPISKLLKQTNPNKPRYGNR